MLGNAFKNKSDSVWIMYSAEGCDPYFSKFVTDKTIVPALSILSNEKKYIIVHELDKENLKDFEGEILICSEENSLVSNMIGILSKLNYPKNIYLNYSDKMDFQTDVLGYGTYRFITDNIARAYFLAGNKKPIFKSADELIYSLLDSKTEDDILGLKMAANRTLEILDKTFKSIKPGMTEKQILHLVHKIFSFKPSYFKTNNIIKEEFSWEKALCPIVLVGPNLEKGGHTAAGNKILLKGYTVYIDFGVKLYFSNGKKYSADLQRMGYVLKPNEKQAPQEIQKEFDTLTQAINIGIKKFIPGTKGYEIDQAVRSHILKSGYPDYNHATGHPVGESAHSPGTAISPKGHKRSGLCLQENGVYTLEPRIQIQNGGSIEEMVRVTPLGGATLCARQTKLYLIK